MKLLMNSLYLNDDNISLWDRYGSYTFETVVYNNSVSSQTHIGNVYFWS